MMAKGTVLAASLAAGVALVAPAQAAFPAQNGKIAFSRQVQAVPFVSPAQYDIFAMNGDGSAQDDLSDNDPGNQDASVNATGNESNPSFSPDGTKIAFDGKGSSTEVGNSRYIYVMNSDGTGQRRLGTGGDVDPSLSPDGKRIAFQSDRGEPSLPKGEIYVMSSADGSGAQRLTNNTSIDEAPAYSPDGTKIAFTSFRDGNSEIYLMNVDGSGQTRLTNNTVSDREPTFSPDGTKIAFASSRDPGTGSRLEIYVMNVDGGAPTRMTNNTSSDGNPAFSPDGTKLAFRTDRDGNDEIYSMNADGTSPTRLTNNTVPDLQPDWGVKPGTSDKTPPDTTITSGPTGTTNDPTPTFEFSSSEPKSNFECRVDSAGFAPCSSPHTTAPLSNGARTFEVRATDPAGNTDPTPASRAFTVNTAGSSDTTPPQTTISSGPEGATKVNTPTFAFNSDEVNSTFQCRVDSQPFASCSSPHPTAQLSDGQHTFEVRATDAAGNSDPTPASRTFTVDTAAPQTTISSGPAQDSTTNDTTPTFAFSSNEQSSTFQCRVDAADFAPCSSPHTTAQLSDGQHTFEVRATDAAGNTDPAPASRTFTVDSSAPADTTPPQTTISSGPANTTSDRTPTFAFRSSEANSTFSCRVDSAAFAACRSPHTTAALAPGRHSFAVYAIDAANNADPTPATRTFTVSAPAARRPAPQRPASDLSDPLIGGLSFRPGRFRAARRGPSIAAKGARVSYRLSEPASVTFRIERVLAGRRAGRRCVSPRRSTRRARRCIRYQTVRGSFVHRGKAGRNTLRFSGRLRGRRLRPGRYRLSAVASDAAGNRSKPRSVGFRVVR